MKPEYYAFVIHKINSSTNTSKILHTRKFALTRKSNEKLTCQLLRDLDFSCFVTEKDVIVVEIYKIKKDRDETIIGTWLKFLKEYSTFKLVTKFVVSIKPNITEYKNSDEGLLRLNFCYRKIIKNDTEKKKELWFSSYEEYINDKNKGKVDILISHPYVELPKKFI